MYFDGIDRCQMSRIDFCCWCHVTKYKLKVRGWNYEKYFHAMSLPSVRIQWYPPFGRQCTRSRRVNAVQANGLYFAEKQSPRRPPSAITGRVCAARERQLNTHGERDETEQKTGGDNWTLSLSHMSKTENGKNRHDGHCRKRERVDIQNKPD
jgi:hypothetical protein